MENKNEIIFKRVMEEKGLTLISQPYIKELKIRPDFYCIENKTYYEVISTRQAYHVRKEKMLRAKQFGIKLQLVNPDGTSYLPGRRGPKKYDILLDAHQMREPKMKINPDYKDSPNPLRRLIFVLGRKRIAFQIGG